MWKSMKNVNVGVLNEYKRFKTHDLSDIVALRYIKCSYF